MLSPSIQPKHPSLLFVPIFSALLIFFVGRAITIPVLVGPQTSLTDCPKTEEKVETADLAGRLGAEYVGTFRGRLLQGGSNDGVPIETVISLRPSGKLAGTYVYESSKNGDESGVLVQEGRIEDRTVRFKWVDAAGTGLLVIKFSEDYKHFDGEWSPRGEPAVEILRARGSFEGLTWSGERTN